MAAVVISEADKKAFNEATQRNYKEQAKFFLNVFWAELGQNDPELENIWAFTHNFIELDYKQGKEGTQLDEVLSHRFLEILGETMTALQLRARLREIDINKDGYMALLEYLLFRYKLNVHTMLTRQQGVNSEELEKAEEALRAVNDQIQIIEDKKKKLEETAEKGGVKGNTAKNELAQLLAADNLELKKALVTAESKVKKLLKNPAAVQTPGALWWMQREIQEAKKYKPKARQN